MLFQSGFSGRAEIGPAGSLKYECVYMHVSETGSQAKAGASRWITFYNHQRPHAAHGGQAPAVVYFNQIETDQQGQRVA
ncbi:transposase [Mameliella alba]|nr:transposase [Mameliella alba]